MIRLLRAFLAGLLLCGATAALACTSGACVSAGPRLASVDSTRGALLNALLGRLTNSTVNVTVGDWQNVAAGSISVAKMIDALQTSLNVSTPSSALSTDTTLATIIHAAASAANADGNITLYNSLVAIANGLTVSTPIHLGQLLDTNGLTGTTRINALEIVSGLVQVYNGQNVLTTPTAISVTGAQLGLAGVLTNLTLSAQVIEPPVYVCGPKDAAFHTATVRIKLGIDLVSITLDSSTLSALALIGSASVKVARLDLYIEVAHADGVLGTIDAITNAMTVTAKPGVVSLYLGTMADNVFFNRSRAIVPATDLGWGTIGSVTINGDGVSLRAKASITGASPTGSLLSFAPPYPQTRTAKTSLNFVANLLTSLMGNLTISITPSLGGVIDALIMGVLELLVRLQLPAILSNVLTLIGDPLLELLGVRLGEVDVTVHGAHKLCAVAGCVYNDANHSSQQDTGESGTATTLYAKLVDTTRPAGPAYAVVPVDPATGTFTFTDVALANYTVVINGANNTTAIVPAAPAGWLATETPTLSRAVTVAGDTSGQRFGLYRGSRVSGTVFNDNGAGGANANNGVQDGAEAAIVGVPVRALDAGTSAIIDAAVTGNAGAYTLWLPYTATAVKVTQPASPNWLSVGGSAGTTGGAYAVATDTTTFTASSGTSATGVNFADVPVSRLDTDGQQSVAPGGVVFYPHTFTAGTAGVLSFAAMPAVATPGWSASFFTDTNCNGKLDAGEPAMLAPVPVVADQRVCVVVKVFAPLTAAYNQQQGLAITGHLALSNSTLAVDHGRTDLTIVAQPSDTGLRLSKSVDRATASTGDTLVYTITYLNQGSTPLASLKIHDAAPAYTVLAAAGCGASPSPSLVCTVTTKPLAGAAGPVAWTFAGTLPSGASGTVTFSVVVN